jgi:chromosomal replication initiation ATPase DnaA
MNHSPGNDTKTARHIVRSAQQSIKCKTGITVDLVICPADEAFMTPDRMLRIIAIALDMNPECFRLKNRQRNVSELRFIGAALIRRYFPNTTLHQIATLFGGQDHTSVISRLSRAYDLLCSGDMRFITKYNTALNSVDLWLRKMGSGYASATSA